MYSNTYIICFLNNLFSIFWLIKTQFIVLKDVAFNIFKIRSKTSHMYNLMVCRDTKHIDNSHPCSFTTRVPGGSMTWSLDLAAHTSLSPIRHGFAPSFAAYQKGCTRLAAASDNVYQRLAQGRWFSPGTPASSTTKTGRHNIAEKLLKVALKHQKSNQKIKSFIT